MRPLPLSQLAAWIEAEIIGDPDALVGEQVVIDSRQLSPGCLFVAIKGERFDGHDYAPVTTAAALLVSRPVDSPLPQLLVEDTVKALSLLAKALVALERGRGMRTLALTGSSGKTSTKDLLAQVLEKAGATIAPPGSLNNEVGVPLTACRVDAQTDYLVSEFGARGPGHIAWLTSLVPADVAVVINVGSAHAGEFGGIEATANAKAELVESLGDDAWAILNGDDHRVAAMAARTKAKVGWFTVGAEPAGEVSLAVCALGMTLDELGRPGATLRVHMDGEVSDYSLQLGLVGEHQMANATAAAAAAIAAGISPQAAVEALAAAQPRSPWRMELHSRHDGVLVLNDAYNANPDSMRAGLATLRHLRESRRGDFPQARAVAILGDMLELGDQATRWHEEIAADAGVDLVLAVGNYAPDLVRGARSAGIEAMALDKAEVGATLALAPGDVVLVKGSRSVGLETLAQQLVEGA